MNDDASAREPITPERKRSWGVAALSAAIALQALVVMAIAVDASNLNYNPAASLQRMLSGTADNPFGQRVLLPWTIRIIRGLNRHSAPMRYAGELAAARSPSGCCPTPLCDAIALSDPIAPRRDLWEPHA